MKAIRPFDHFRGGLSDYRNKSDVGWVSRTASQILSFFFGLLLGSHNKDIVASRVRCRR